MRLDRAPPLPQVPENLTIYNVRGHSEEGGWSMCKPIRDIQVFCVITLVLAGFAHSVMADTEANKEAVRRITEEAWSQGQLAVIDEFVSPDYVFHDPTLGDMKGPDGLKQTIMYYRTAYPDLRFTVDDLIAEGNLVADRWSVAGTHQGELMGIPATGLQTTSVGINIVRFEDGKIVEEWSNWDALGLMQQLGVVEPPRPGPEWYLWDADSEITGAAGDSEENKLLVLRVKKQFWTDRDIAGLDETHHPDAVGHDNSLPGGERTYESYKQACIQFLTVFPDLGFTVDSIFAEDDKVVVRWSGTGTQQGELMGVPASGKYATYTGMTIYRLADGKIAESWWAYDALGLMQQITSPPEYSPVGTWLVSSPTEVGDILLLHSIHPQDSTGMSFGGFVKQVNNNPTFFGMIPEGESGVDLWASQTQRIAPNTYESTLLYYITKAGHGPLEETVGIGVVNANWTITGPDTNEGDATISIYLAAQDADADGLPDEGEEPAICAPFIYTSKRLKPMPGCIPAPMPEGATQ